MLFHTSLNRTHNIMCLLKYYLVAFFPAQYGIIQIIKTTNNVEGVSLIDLLSL